MYQGHHDWIFGWRDELAEFNSCLAQQYFEFLFAVNTRPESVFRGVRVFDTPASRSKIRTIIDSLSR